ncbi:hypothetical protein Mal15_43810 [Stieleria maiorica]|uniref:Uncharacterized protein n=1 Tax=Stieleria maiorica TaxID=2795974 RepID=A0A5B9MK05_9BACT|nr:hypothetical protein [Stieleria maiorica]QEG00311.1 hypothetical protein Mal15_43810 [Stieleria maiorica]
MKSMHTKKLVKANMFYWVAAMALPIIFDLGLKAFASDAARFPWIILIPPLFLGLGVASNQLIIAAADAPGHAEPDRQSDS